MRRPAALISMPVTVLAMAGCGGGDDGSTTTNGGRDSDQAGAPVYEGSTEQRQPVKIVADRNLLVTVRLLLDCKDGSDSRVTLTSDPKTTTLQSDGSFYYQEDGRTKASVFPGFGPGRYRGAIQGELKGERGDGTAAFRITFRETSCRASTEWAVRLKT